MDGRVPFEVGFERAKVEIINAAATIAHKYSILTALLNIMMSNIALEAKLNTYETIIGNFDISVPSGMGEDTPDQVISMKEPEPTLKPDVPSKKVDPNSEK